MIDSLKRYVEAIFSQLGYAPDFEVYDCAKTLLPRLMGFNRGYLVCFSGEADPQAVQQFIGKPVSTRGSVHYWLEGVPRRLEQTGHAAGEGERCFQRLDQGKAVIGDGACCFQKPEGESPFALPAWLDRLIFEDMGAVYAPSGREGAFNSNLDSTEDKILRYLGTYFPRSFAEIYAINCNLFSKPSIRSQMRAKREYSVCSVGTGTGGDLLGLLLALDGVLPPDAKVRVLSLEGNAMAHDKARAVLEESKKHMDLRADVDFVDVVFSDLLSLGKIPGVAERTYDYVLTSKMINELVASDDCLGNSYYDFCRMFFPLLNHDAFCLIHDVTSKPADESCDFFPKLMNGQVNRALHESRGFTNILPSSCAQHGEGCRHACFNRMIMRISHSRKCDDQAKSWYRLVGKSASSCLAERVGSAPAPYPSMDNATMLCENCGPS